MIFVISAVRNGVVGAGAGGARCGCQDRGGLRVPSRGYAVTRLRGYATVSTKTTVADGRLRVTDRELRVIGASTGTVKYEYWYPNQEIDRWRLRLRLRLRFV